MFYLEYFDSLSLRINRQTQAVYLLIFVTLFVLNGKACQYNLFLAPWINSKRAELERGRRAITENWMERKKVFQSPKECAVPKTSLCAFLPNSTA